MECLAALQIGERILLPARFIKIGSQEITGVIFQQGINAYRMLTGQVVIDDTVCHWEKLALLAHTTLDARFPADAWSPFILTGRRIS